MLLINSSLKKNIIVFFIMIFSFSSYAYDGSLNLYKVKKEVFDYSSSAREEAIRSALNQVLVKLTVDKDIVNNKNLKEQITDVDKFVNKFEYFKNNNNVYINIDFNKKILGDLLLNLKIPVIENRPTILAWVAIEDNGGTRILGNNNNFELEKILLNKSSELGIPVTIPLFDIEDHLNVQSEDIVIFDWQKIKSASYRYNPDFILIGNVFKYDDKWNFKWKILSNDSENNSQLTWISYNDSLFQETDKLLDRIIIDVLQIKQNKSEIASEKEFVKEKSKIYKNEEAIKDSQILQISISGINSLDQYAAVEKYLQKFSSGKVELLELELDKAKFSLKTKFKINELIKSFKLDNFLVENSNILNFDSVSNSNVLEYKVGS